MQRRTYTLDQLTGATCLLPRIIAEQVISDSDKVSDADYPCMERPFADFAEARTLHLFNHNRAFRRRLLSQNAIDYAYKIVAHWLDGQLKRKEHGIPSCFDGN